MASMDAFEVKGKISLDTDGFDKNLDKAGKSASGFGDKLKNGLKSAAKVSIAAVGAVSTAVVAMVKKSVASYAEYEQIVGGVETLFKDSSDKVMKYANDAYKTAGMSANQYMETVTGFSASLLQSLDGDTAKAAEKANVAITDMSDNANKMGTSMESIQNAYQGFAKQNYTMLDNLKLGYGGTKEEMQRLLEDAEKLSGQKFDISSYSDIVDAIHIVQTEMGITGTTAKEASSTIQGSLQMTKSAWENLLTGLSDKDANIDELIGNLVDSVGSFAGNIIPTIQTALLGVGDLITGLVPIIVEALPTFISELVPMLMDSVTKIIDAIMEQLPSIIDAIISVTPQIFEAALMLMMALGQGLAEALPDLVPSIVDIILEMVNILLDNIPQLMTVARELIFGLIYGLWQAFPDLCAAIGGLVVAFIKASMDFFGVSEEDQNAFADIGLKLIEGLWNGISNAYEWLVEKIQGFTDGITGKIKEFFGIHSPSKLFEKEVGKNLALGIGVGFTTNMDDVESQMQEALPTSLDVDGSVVTHAGSAGSLSEGIGELVGMFKYGTAKTTMENTKDLRRAINA